VNAGTRWLGSRRSVLILIALAGAWAALYLNLNPADAIPGEGGLRLLGKLLAAAVTPALTYEGADVPDTAAPFLVNVARAMWTTVVFAAAAASLSTVFGLILGFFASTAWWTDDPAGGSSTTRRVLRATVAPAIYTVTRLLIALMRSVHELLWAVLFLAAFGLTPLSAVIAIAIPYTGTLAKVFSEVVDEVPRDAASALRGSGASPIQVYLFALLPRALPDVIAYALYRFECALRSSAIVGFFGITTLGYYLRQSFENAQYREVWSYLYGLLILVVVLDAWSGAIRRRLVR
jgi:phosphonate transport system permease protein